MSALVVLPFHQDERLTGDSIALPTAVAATVVEPDLPGGDQWQRLVALYDGLASHVAATVGTATVRTATVGTATVGTAGVTTVLTGDCLALLGTLAGTQRAGLDPSLVWFDAHGDVHTLATSTSGYLGGLALRMALGGDAERLADPLGLRPLPEERAVLVDARDLDPAEITYLASARVRRRTVEDVGPEDLPDGPVVVHVDLDVIDPVEVPGLRFPAPGGPSRRAVLAALQRLTATGRVTVLDVACPWFDAADDAEQQARRVLLTELLARSTSG